MPGHGSNARIKGWNFGIRTGYPRKNMNLAKSSVESDAGQTATRRAGGSLRWWMLGWALAAGIINYMDRSAVSIAAPALISEFGLTRTDIGLMGTVFSWTYALAQLPAGWLVDKVGVRRMYFLAIAVWSIATALMAVGSRLWHFLFFRTLLGIAEAPNGPASSKLTADWFPRSERGQATAIWDSGSK